MDEHTRLLYKVHYGLRWFQIFCIAITLFALSGAFFWNRSMWIAYFLAGHILSVFVIWIRYTVELKLLEFINKKSNTASLNATAEPSDDNLETLLADMEKETNFEK